MTPEDYEIAVKLCDRDPEFKKLWEEHHELKSRLKELREKGLLTPDEEMEMKKIKRIKLWGKDRIAQLIRDYKVGVSAPG